MSSPVFTDLFFRPRQSRLDRNSGKLEPEVFCERLWGCETVGTKWRIDGESGISVQTENPPCGVVLPENMVFGADQNHRNLFCRQHFRIFGR